MQDLKALEGKSLAELREIAKAIGIEDIMIEEARTDRENRRVRPLPKAAPAENKEKADEPKREVPATEMQQTAAVAEAAAVEAEAASETDPKAPRGRRPRITDTKTENTAPAQRTPRTGRNSPCRAGAPDGKRRRHLHQRQRLPAGRTRPRQSRRRPNPSAAAASPKRRRQHRKRQQSPVQEHPRRPRLPGRAGRPSYGSSRIPDPSKRRSSPRTTSPGRSRAKACWRSCPTATDSSARPTTTT